METVGTLVIIAIGLGVIALIPLNIWVAKEVRKLAVMDPPIDILSLLSSLVSGLASIAVIIGVISVSSIITLTTAIRIIPVPGSTIFLILALVGTSSLNVVVWRYLRRTRNAREDAA